MNIINGVRRFENKYKFIYIAIYTAFVCMNKIVDFSLILGNGIISTVYNLLAIVGICFLIIEFFGDKSIFKTKYNSLIVLFIFITFISCIVNVRYGLMKNVKTLVWMCIQMLLVYSMSYGKDTNTIKRQVRVIGNIIIAIWFVGVVCSLYQFVMQIGWTIQLPDNPKITRMGFVDNRLFGVFSDPNCAAAVSLFACFLSVMNYKWSKHKALKVFYVINIILQLFYVSLSGSRSALVLGGVGVFISVLMIGREYIKKHYGIEKTSTGAVIKRVLALAVAGVLGVGIFVGCNSLIKASLQRVPYAAYIVMESLGIKTKKVDQVIDMKRKDVEDNQDISNNRFKIWSNGIEVFKSSPVIGTSPRNYLKYAEDKLGNIYIVKEQYELHSGYISVLVFTGALGAICMCCYIVLAGVKVIKLIFEKKPIENLDVIVPVMSIVAMMVAFTAFVSITFFGNSIFEVYFWLMLGVLLNLIENTQEGDSNTIMPVSYKVAALITSPLNRKKKSKV